MADDLLVQIRDGMHDLAEMQQPECRNVIVGLLLILMDLSHRVDGETAHLLCQIHADARQAWIKAHPARHEEAKDG